MNNLLVDTKQATLLDQVISSENLIPDEVSAETSSETHPRMDYQIGANRPRTL
jgi:hypothetical protein